MRKMLSSLFLFPFMNSFFLWLLLRFCIHHFFFLQFHYFCWLPFFKGIFCLWFIKLLGSLSLQSSLNFEIFSTHCLNYLFCLTLPPQTPVTYTRSSDIVPCLTDFFCSFFWSFLYLLWIILFCSMFNFTDIFFYISNHP
jgi:hypothetical protein